MKVNHEYERMPANEVWNVVVAYINKNKQFLSSTGIKYNAKVIIDSIEYKGGRVHSDQSDSLGHCRNRQTDSSR